MCHSPFCRPAGRSGGVLKVDDMTTRGLAIDDDTLVVGDSLLTTRTAAGDGEIMNGMSRPRVAAITGAAQGIGQRTALLLAERGYALALNDLRACGETLTEVRRHG